MNRSLIKRILEAIENNLNLRGDKGHGAGHPYTHGRYRPVYGKSNVEYKEDEYETNQESEEIENPVKVSKAFQEKFEEEDYE